MRKSNRGLSGGGLLRAVLATALLAGAGTASAGELFKCGKTFQDRPCESADVQQRFSRTQGTFAIQQVNPTTDRDCAKAAAEAMTWWDRLARGESMDKLQGEIQAQKISRYDKSMLRDTLTVVGSYRGTRNEVRSQFEVQCMAYKRKHGYPTERELAGGATSGSYTPRSPASDAATRRAEIAAQRAAVARARAEAARDRLR